MTSTPKNTITIKLTALQAQVLTEALTNHMEDLNEQDRIEYYPTHGYHYSAAADTLRKIEAEHHKASR